MATADNPSVVPHIRVSSDASRAPLNLRELLRYRDLLLALAERDIRVRYKQTVLGVSWVALQPLMTSLIFTFVFGVIARLPSNGVPYVLFAFAGLMAWTTFSNTLLRSSSSVLGNAHVVSKVYFPKLILPLSSVASTLIDFCLSLLLMVGLLAIYRVWPGPGLLLLPVWLAILMVMALGIGLLAAAYMVEYRDIGHIIPAFLQLGLYVSPVAWSTRLVPEKFRWVFMVNPLSGLLEAFRWSLLGEGSLSLPSLAYATAAAGLAFWIGSRAFRNKEQNFADVI